MTTLTPAALSGLTRCLHCGVRADSVCGVLSNEELASLAAIAEVQSVPRGQAFIEEQSPASAFFNISGGTAKLTRTLPDGRQQITGFVRSGDFLGLAATESFAFGAEAIEPLGICRFPRRRLEALLSRMPHLEHRLLQVACRDLARAQSAMLLLGRKTATERVASFLRDWAADHRPGAAIALPMTRGEIADYLGLTIETVSRILSRLRREGVIDTQGNHTLIVRQPKSLALLAGDEEEDALVCTRKAAL